MPAGAQSDLSASEQLAYIVSELESVSQLPSLFDEYYTTSYHDGHPLSDGFSARKEVSCMSVATLPVAMRVWQYNSAVERPLLHCSQQHCIAPANIVRHTTLVLYRYQFAALLLCLGQTRL